MNGSLEIIWCRQHRDRRGQCGVSSVRPEMEEEILLAGTEGALHRGCRPCGMRHFGTNSGSMSGLDARVDGVEILVSVELSSWPVVAVLSVFVR